jgi:glutamine cyclotransferase
VREVDLETGAVRLRTSCARNVFAEGLALVRGGTTLLQLTWRSGAGLSYDARSLALTGAFTTPLPDGWGLTTNGDDESELFATDGSAHLSVLDADSLTLKRQLTVTDGGAPVALLNELEWVDGEVWANVWMTECVARINPETGVVNGWLLLHGLRASLASAGGARGGDDVLNGIAWDANRRRLFVTGKYWPRLFQIEPRRMDAASDGDVAEARRKCNPGGFRGFARHTSVR